MKLLTVRAALLITVSCCCFAMVMPVQAYAQKINNLRHVVD